MFAPVMWWWPPVPSDLNTHPWNMLPLNSTGSCELSNLADVGSLGSLTAGVGVDFGIEDEDVDVLAGSQNVVNTAEADVVCPAVAAEDPEGLLLLGSRQGKKMIRILSFILSLNYPSMQWE